MEKIVQLENQLVRSFKVEIGRTREHEIQSKELFSLCRQTAAERSKKPYHVLSHGGE